MDPIDEKQLVASSIGLPPRQRIMLADPVYNPYARHLFHRGTVMPSFTDENIERLFGAEAAEDEIPERLKEYFYINKTYENIRNNLPIRVLVGHKGIGKSALLKRSYLDDVETNQICVWIQPTDLTELSSIKDAGDFNQQIDAWKRGILRVVAKKLLDEFTGGATPTMI